jgi:hypothetical protein
MSKTELLAPLLAAAAALAPTASMALIQQDRSGQWVNSSQDPEWKNSAAKCWRAGYLTPAHAIMECVSKAGPAERRRPEGKSEKQAASRNPLPPGNKQ